jgi:hypothetical protein
VPGTFSGRVGAEWTGTFWASRRGANVPGTFTRSQEPKDPMCQALSDAERCRVDRHILSFKTMPDAEWTGTF